MDEFLGILLISLLTLMRRTYSSSSLFVILFNLPGIILHELSHYAVALITNGKPSGFTLIPRKIKHEGRTYWILGSVNAYITPFNNFFIGTAPLVLIPISYLIFKFWLSYFPENIFSKLSLYLIVYIFIYNSIPSKQDWRVAFYYKRGLIPPVILLIGLLFLL